MWKALLKKQMLEFNSFFFQNKKTGQRRSRKGIIGYAVLYAVLFLFVGVAFFAMGIPITVAVAGTELEWLYFAMMGMIAIFLGVFGDVFNTYAGLYHAKDNELLLSLPVPPGKLLGVRMVSVYLMGLFYTALAFVPATIAFWVFGGVTPGNVLCPIILLFVMSVFVMTLSCALGWVVALISARLKSKTFVTVLASIAFMGLYYVVYFRISTYLQEFASHAEGIGRKIKSAAYPFYALGRAAQGHIPSLLLFTAAVAALFALTYYVMSRNFSRIVTMKKGAKKTVYHEQTAKVASVRSALLRKELRRFLGSSTYMLNSGLGLFILLALSVFCLIRMNWIHGGIDIVAAELPELASLLPVAAVLSVGLIVCMNAISAPSLSLEGKSLWLMQSLPVMPQEVLDAKYRFAMYMNMGPSVLCTVVLGLAIRADVGVIGYMVVFMAVLVMLLAQAGVVLNLRHPNLTWTSEVVPIKQGASVTIIMFGGWALLLAIGAGAYFSRKLIASDTYLLAVAIVLALCSRFLNKWLRTKGTEIFASL